MGQKTNPIGNRLGIIRGWDSSWYGGRDYGDKLAEDDKIRKYINARLSRASVSSIIFERSVKDISKGANDNSISSIDIVLRERGSSFREALNQMAIANHLLTSNLEAGQYRYEEGDAYRNYGIEPHLTQSFSLTGTETIIEYTGSQLMHNGTHYIGFDSMNQDAIKLSSAYIPIVRIYDKVLSMAEIEQNYNALKGRYI